MINKPTLHALNAAGEAEVARASILWAVIDQIAQPTPAMRWLERAGKQLRETREAE